MKHDIKFKPLEKYTLHITKGITSTKGSLLLKEAIKDFTTIADNNISRQVIDLDISENEKK